MKLKAIKYSPEEVSEYLLKRLQPEKKDTEKSGKKKPGNISGRKKTNTIGKEGPLSPYQIEQKLKDLGDLILEKSDLLKQIASDEYLLGVPRKSVTQDEVLSILDDLKSIVRMDIRALISRIEPKQVFRTSIEQAQHRLTETDAGITELIADEEIARAYREKHGEKDRGHSFRKKCRRSVQHY